MYTVVNYITNEGPFFSGTMEACDSWIKDNHPGVAGYSVIKSDCIQDYSNWQRVR